MLGFAIVGCGMIARFHARALADVPGTKLVALVSRSTDSARKMRDELKLHCDLTTNLDEVLEREDVNAVVITTPSGAHAEPALAAANAKKHVVVEKPLEVTLERCDRIIDACAKNKVQLCTIFPSRTPRRLIHVSTAMLTSATSRCGLNPIAIAFAGSVQPSALTHTCALGNHA